MKITWKQAGAIEDLRETDHKYNELKGDYSKTLSK